MSLEEAKRQTHTEGRRPREDRGRAWSDAATNQVMPKIAGNHQKLEERHRKYSSLQASEREQSPADTLISELILSETSNGLPPLALGPWGNHN